MIAAWIPWFIGGVSVLVMVLTIGFGAYAIKALSDCKSRIAGYPGDGKQAADYVETQFRSILFHTKKMRARCDHPVFLPGGCDGG